MPCSRRASGKPPAEARRGALAGVSGLVLVVRCLAGERQQSDYCHRGTGAGPDLCRGWALALNSRCASIHRRGSAPTHATITSVHAHPRRRADNVSAMALQSAGGASARPSAIGAFTPQGAQKQRQRDSADVAGDNNSGKRETWKTRKPQDGGTQIDSNRPAAFWRRNGADPRGESTTAPSGDIETRKDTPLQ